MIEIKCLVCDEKIGSMPEESEGKTKPCCCTDPRCEKVFRTVSLG